MCVILARPRRLNGSVTGTAWTTVSSALCSRLRASARANAVLAGLEKSTAQRMRESSITISAPSRKKGGRRDCRFKPRAMCTDVLPRYVPFSSEAERAARSVALSAAPPDTFRGKRRTIGASRFGWSGTACKAETCRQRGMRATRLRIGSSFQRERAQLNVKA
jgi:hypothetical protein